MRTKWTVVSPHSGMDEDAPANAAGGGNVAGLGIDHPDRPGSGEPGKKKKKKHLLFHALTAEDSRAPRCFRPN